MAMVVIGRLSAMSIVNYIPTIGISPEDGGKQIFFYLKNEDVAKHALSLGLCFGSNPPKYKFYYEGEPSEKEEGLMLGEVISIEQVGIN